VRYEQRVKNVSEKTSSHEARISQLSLQREVLEKRANRISLFRLITFIASASALVAGLKQATPLALPLALLLGLAFFGAVAWHARVISRQKAVEVRIDIHRRHLARIAGTWHELPSQGLTLIPPSHPYASDIDLIGSGSLFQRIDVSQTREGERALATALAEPARPEIVRARQEAVRELSEKHAFREEIEALGSLHQQRDSKLDHTPFMALFALPSLFEARRWLKPLALSLVTITLACIVAVKLDVLPSSAIWACVFVQGLLLWSLKEPVHRALDLLTARIGFAQAYEGMFRMLESETLRSAHLRSLQQRLNAQGAPASKLMARLSRYEGFAQLRTQGPLYIVLNLLTLWDLFCLERIEHFGKQVGPHCEDWFRVIGELELLSSFATLLHVDVDTSFPELVDGDAGLVVAGLIHPLLPAHSRVENDLTLHGSGSALIVTGSNMAGKSTLLRAVGLNVALALGGGPVCARSFRIATVRLRASMRIDDSLQRGASYFHAELTRLRMVVGELADGPPVLFLLDELLRGTNAHARHQGARAVLLHLLRRHALGLVATHDVALSELEGELPGSVQNVHFTDVYEGGEMRFDYKLRAGVVKTSNALRLLAMAGIEVPDSDALS
jgi:hypothetical protein